MTGLITNIQRFSTHDGPGIRTTVFFKGCPLRCKWCHNPETIALKPEIQFFSEICVGCGSCADVCPNGAHRLENGTLNILGVAGLYAGQLWLNKQGIERINVREMDLWDRLRLGLQAIDGVVTYCAERRESHVPVLSFNISGWEPSEVGAILNTEYNIICRTGLHCAPLVHEGIGTDKLYGTVRFSLGPFNTEEHIDRVVAAVDEIAAAR